MKKLAPKIQIRGMLIAGVAAFAVFGTFLSIVARSHAAGSTTMSITPSTQTVAQGSDVSFDVTINTNGDGVNAMQSTITFDATKFTFVSVTAGDFNTGFTHSETSNTVNFAGGFIGTLTGTKIGAHITLHATAGVTDSPLTFSSICTDTTDSTCSTVLDSTTNNNDLASTTDGAITVTPAAPSNTGLPLISGTDTVGSTLSTTNGTWDNSPTSFTYQWKDCDSGGANCVDVASAGTGSTYDLVSGDSGHTIRVVVTAINTGGSGNATSAATSVVTTPSCTIPSTPGTPSLDSSTYTTIDLSWTASTANSPCSLSGYYIYRALVTGGTPGSYSQVGTSATNSFSDSGLVANHSYSYYIVAYDDGANSSSNGSAATLDTAADNLPPTAPTNLKLTLDGPSQVDVSWTASSENPSLGGVSIDHYAISRATVTGGVPGSYSQVGTTSDGTTTSYQDSTVANNTVYSYKVTGVDAFNSSPDSSAAQTQTFDCTVVSGVSTCTLASSIDLSTTDAIGVANETIVNDGTLGNVTGHNSSSVKGGGSMASLTVNGGGTVAPGHSPGCLTVNGNLIENGNYTAEIQSPGATACTDYDQIVVTGTVNLSNSILDTELLGGFTPSVGQTYEIINNQGGSAVTGNFSGLAQSAVFAVGSSRMQISYTGGDGNDVVLTVVSPTTPITATPTAPNTGTKLVSTNIGEVLAATLVSCVTLLAIAYRLGWKGVGASKRAGR